MSEALGRIRGARIAQLIESDGPGGAERMLALLAGELQAGGCPTVAFLPADREGWLTRALREAGVTVEYFRLDRAYSPQFARDLTAAFRRHRITVAHSHEFTLAVYGAWAARRAGIGHVITLHGGRYWADRLRRRLALRMAAASSGGLVAVSAPLAAELCRDLRLQPPRVDMIPNGIRPEAAAPSPVRAELGLGPADHLLLAVGNLYPVKGHRVLIEALALLRDRAPTLHVAIAGRGELEQELAARASALGVGDRLHLLGLRADVAGLLAAADGFVLPSLSEGLPLALLEAMFAGRPIVASAVGDIPTALAEGAAGHLVPPNDAGALAAAIERLISRPDEARALGGRATCRAKAEYDLSRMVARYATRYETVMPA